MDDTKKSQYIERVQAKGYRMIASVNPNSAFPKHFLESVSARLSAVNLVIQWRLYLPAMLILVALIASVAVRSPAN